MTVYVLVGRVRAGRESLARGWCWQDVARRLRQAGYEVYPVTLTGLGEHAHLTSPNVDLETHITDVVNLCEFEDLREVVLVGHSYAGIVVTGVADWITERLSLLAYLDAGPVTDGVAFLDAQQPEARTLGEVVKQSGFRRTVFC